MNTKQRGLVWKCVVVAGMVGFCFAYLDRPWLRWVLLAAFPLAILFEKRPDRPPDIQGWIEAHPFVKIWLVICALAIAAVTYATTNSIVRFDEILGFGGMFGLLGIMISPLIAVGVLETYREYGDDDSA